MLRSRSRRSASGSWESGSEPSTATFSELEDQRLFPYRSHNNQLFAKTRCLRLLFAGAFFSVLVLIASFSILQSSTIGRIRLENMGCKIRAFSYPVNRTHIPPLSGFKTLPLGKFPRVDRSILERLASMEQSNGDSPSQSIKKHAWPPIVTHVPEAKPPNPSQDLLQQQFQHEPVSTASLTHFDLSTCGKDTCRFILPLRIGEQESKARLHFLQILELAGSSKRIVVLPNVGKSRMGACFKWGFEKYYDVEDLKRQVNGGDLRVVDMETFRRWVATRPIMPRAQFVSITSKQFPEPSSSEYLFSENGVTLKIEHDQDPLDPQISRCIPMKFPRLRIDAFSPVFVYPSKKLKSKLFGSMIVDVLERRDMQNAAIRSPAIIHPNESIYGSAPNNDVSNTDDTASSPDVIVLNYDLRHPAFASSQVSINPTLSYSLNLSMLASNLLTPLEPQDYLVIHWRMETVPQDTLPSCAELLVRSLEILLQNQNEDLDKRPVTTIWFASDYPHPISRTFAQSRTPKDSRSKSGTFRSIGAKHEEAIEILRLAFDNGGRLERNHITGLAEEFARIRHLTMDQKGQVVNGDFEGELMEDTGVLGILDKIVASQAALFVSGGQGCGRASSFTQQIIDSRLVTNNSRVEPVRNIVHYFGS